MRNGKIPSIMFSNQFVSAAISTSDNWPHNSSYDDQSAKQPIPNEK